MTAPAKLISVLFLATGFFLAGYSVSRRVNGPTSVASGHQSITYTCPMHPQYTSDRAGDCSICGMRLVRPDSGEDGDKQNPAMHDRPGMVQISAASQQLIGVRTDEVRVAADAHLLRVPGRIALDDQRLYRIVAAADGWVVDLRANTAGSFVRKDQLLASYYQKDLLYAEQLFLLSIPSNEPLPAQQKDFSQASIRTAGSANPRFPIDSLRELGMSDLQIRQIHRTREASPHIGIYSPVSGFVLSRNLSPSQRFEKGTELYRIADISRVWVMTDIFEKDREFLPAGATAVVRYRGREFQARLSDALPQLDPQTRTLKARFEVDNPGNLLLPDMFVDVELHVEMPPAISVPAEAILDSGQRKVVYVARGEGLFEPRLVEVGWRLGDRVQVTRGLEPGAQIVVSGNFLLDSESRMKLSASGAAVVADPMRAAKDPICAMEVDTTAKDGARQAQHQGRTYYFCSEQCRRTFQSDPGKYVPGNMRTAQLVDSGRTTP
jgi:YHS domain-containing protein